MIKHSDKIPVKIKSKDYTVEAVQERQKWLAKKLNIELSPINAIPNNPNILSKNIENLVGSLNVPLAITGPLLINGNYAKGLFYVPFATTQGTLVESYHRGMIAITLSGGANTFLQENKIDITPGFIFDSVTKMPDFISWVNKSFEDIKSIAESTTKYGKLINIKPYVIGKKILLNFVYTTGDASGLNMINIATYKVCEYIMQNYKGIVNYYLRSNLSSDKKPSFFNLINSYGKRITAEIIIPNNIVRKYLLTTPEKFYDFWITSLLGSFQAGMIGTNAHYANALASIFLATGQDIAQIVNASVGISTVDVTKEGNLYVSANLPCLVVGTIGGGTSLPFQNKCLEILDCCGDGKVEKLSEIIAASVLAGEISIGAALSSGQFAQADIKLRNR
jgi:hydroxymethylglutaryl-CoA reductase (NADPH)